MGTPEEHIPFLDLVLAPLEVRLAECQRRGRELVDENRWLKLRIDAAMKIVEDAAQSGSTPSYIRTPAQRLWRDYPKVDALKEPLSVLPQNIKPGLVARFCPCDDCLMGAWRERQAQGKRKAHDLGRGCHQ